MHRKARVVLPAREALLLRSGNDAAVNDEGQLFIEGGTPEDDKWADGDSMSDEDRNAAIIG